MLNINNQKLLRLKQILLYSLILCLTSCVDMRTPSPIGEWDTAEGVDLQSVIPDDMPKNLNQFKDSQFLVVHAKHGSEFGVDLLVPVPFVTDMIYDQKRQADAENYHSAFAEMNPYHVTLDAIKESKTFINPDSPFKLYPMVILAEGDNDMFRFSLFYELHHGNRLGRYFYHLPSMIAAKDITAPSQQQLETFQRELAKGVDILLPIIKQDMSASLPNTGRKITVASRFIVGGKVGGLVSPDLVRMKNVEVLAETENTYLLRAPGNFKAHADDGAFWFGIHYFYKDQISYLKIQK